MVEEYLDKFNLDENYCYKNIIITKIYDGDSITVNINLGLDIYLNNVKIRLYGINASELRGEEKNEGKEAKELLEYYLKNNEICIYTIKDKKDKYGRLLGILINKHDRTNYNLKMLECKYVKPYFI